MYHRMNHILRSLKLTSLTCFKPVSNHIIYCVIYHACNIPCIILHDLPCVLPCYLPCCLLWIIQRRPTCSEYTSGYQSQAVMQHFYDFILVHKNVNTRLFTFPSYSYNIISLVIMVVLNVYCSGFRTSADLESWNWPVRWIPVGKRCRLVAD